jgi:hypothetical protein
MDHHASGGDSHACAQTGSTAIGGFALSPVGDSVVLAGAVGTTRAPR